MDHLSLKYRQETADQSSMVWQRFLGCALVAALLGTLLSFNPFTPFTPADAAGTSYRDAVIADSPSQYYRLNETSGTSAADASGNSRTGTISGTPVMSQGGALMGTADNSIRLRQNDYVDTPGLTNPTTYTQEVWFKTSSKRGGRISGFRGASNFDRIIYMSDNGTLNFGAYDNSAGATRTISSSASYNDGLWHMVTATQSTSAGMVLYVDGAQVAANATYTVAQSYTGTWRLGFDSVFGWPNIPSQYSFAGEIDEAAYWNTTALTSTRVAAHYNANPRSLATWQSVFSNYKPLNIKAGSALTAGYSVSLTFDHAAMVPGSSLASGDDLRVAYNDGSKWIELDRTLAYGSSWNSAATKIEFELQAAVAAGATSTSYAIFSGWSGTAAPNADPNHIYFLWDDFSAPALDSDKWNTFTSSGISVGITSGQARISGTSATDSSQYNYSGFNVLNTTPYGNGDGFEYSSTFAIVNQTYRANQADYHWKAQIGMKEQMAAISTDGPAKVSYYNAGWQNWADSTLNGQLPSARVTQKRIGNTVSHSENGAFLGSNTRSDATTQDPTFSFSSNSASEARDVRFDDIVIRRAVANAPSVLIAGDTSYRAAITADQPSNYYRLNETTGSSIADLSGNGQSGTIVGSPVLAQGGALVNNADNAVRLRAGDYLLTPTNNASTNVYTQEVWFKTSSVFGGRIMGWSNANQSNYDRMVWMNNAGQLTYGVYTGAITTVTSPSSYNDGLWHMLAVTLSPAGMAMYVDGTSVGSTASATAGEPGNGGWRLGKGTLDNWNNLPTYTDFSGELDEWATWSSSALSLSQIQAHYNANPRSLATWQSTYSTYKPLTITAGSALPAGYSATLTLDHAALVTAGKSQALGNDLRVAYNDGSKWIELDRTLAYGSSWNNASTKIEFRLRTALSASASTTSYAVFTGWAGAGSPNADGNHVYTVWDDFSAPTLDTTKWNPYWQAGIAIDVAGGAARVSGTSATDATQYNYSGFYGRNSAIGTGDGFEYSTSMSVIQQTYRAAQSDYHWKANIGLSENAAYVYTDGPPKVAYFNSGVTNFGTSNLSGQYPSARVVQRRIGDTITHSENGTQTATNTRTNTNTQWGTWGFSTNTASEARDVRFDDIVIRRYVASAPTLVFTNTAPNNASALAQYEADGTTAVPTGAWVSTAAPVFKAMTSDPDSSDTNALCVEVKAVTVAFSNTENACGTQVNQGTVASVVVSGLSDTVKYHWQARTRDAAGVYSAWQSFGGNSDVVTAATDFAVATNPTWWNNTYSQRLPISVSAASGNAVPADYSIGLSFDHAALVTAGALSSGDDLRVAYFNGSAWTEIDRVLDYGTANWTNNWNKTDTKIWFKTQAPISAGTTSSAYYLYYGKASPGTPPADGVNVFLIRDEFTGSGAPSAAWTTTAQSGIAVTQGAGELKIAGTSASGSETARSGIATIFPTAAGYMLESNFRIVSQSAGAQQNWLGDFGANRSLVVQSAASPSKLLGYGTGPFVPVGSSTLNGATVSNHRVAQGVTAAGLVRHFEDGQLLATRSGGATGNTNPGVSFSAMASGQSFDVRYDNVVIRKYVDVEPTASVTIPTSTSMLSFSVGGHLNACNGILPSTGASSSASAIDFGVITPLAASGAAQDLTVSTNAKNGYVVQVSSSGFASSARALNPVSGTNSAPSAFVALGTEGFGYTTSDADLSGGTFDRFTKPGALWAGLTGTNSPVLSGTGPVSGATSCVAYQVSAAANSPAGSYTGSVTYTAVPSF